MRLGFVADLLWWGLLGVYAVCVAVLAVLTICDPSLAGLLLTAIPAAGILALIVGRWWLERGDAD
jgi:hypothetical protein